MEHRSLNFTLSIRTQVNSHSHHLAGNGAQAIVAENSMKMGVDEHFLGYSVRTVFSVWVFDEPNAIEPGFFLSVKTLYSLD